MAREFVLRQGEDESPEYDLTDATSAVHVIWEEMEVGGRAFRGESDAGIIPMRDEQGETGDDVNLPSGLEIVSLSRGSTWEWIENAGEAGEVVMARGRIGPKDYSRGRQKADRAREVSVTVTDPNEHLQLIIVDDWVRPEETDVERVTALLAAYLDGDPRPTTVIAGTYVSSANPVTLEAHTYDGSSPHEVLQDVALKSNKNFFVTVDNELFYDAWDSTAYPAGIRISDRPEEWDDEGGELFGRLYFSGTNVDDPELAFDSVWDGAAAGAQVELTLTKGTTVDDSVSGNPEATPPKDRGLRRGMYQLSGTGTLSGHVKCFIRAYDGEDDPFSSQSTQSQMVIKIFSEDGSTLRGVVLDAYEPVALDSTDWDGTLRNTKFPASALWEGTNGAPINTVHWEDGDWLVVEVGYRFFAAEGSAEGGVYFNDTAATADLPEDEVETDNLAPWIEFTPSASITVGPIWDVGAASTEDGLELRCGMRLYYGEEGAYVYHHDDTIHDRYWHSEESVYTSDPTITDATKAEALLLAMYERRKEEERTYNLSIGPLNEDQVGLIKYGQLIYVKARAIPDADDQFMPRRIAQLRWTTPRPGVFFARMQLSRPRKQEPYSVGPKDAVQTTTKHATAGTHPASNITIIDSGAYYSGNDVEAALQEIGDELDGIVSGGASVGLDHFETEHRFRISAHRGDIGSEDSYPENTLEAVRQAALKGADSCEIDVKRSSDGTWWLMHDTTLDRTTDGTGAPSSKTDAQMAALNIDGGLGYDAGRHGTSLDVPTLDSVIDAVRPYNLMLVLHLVTGVAEAEYTALANYIVANSLQDRVWVLCGLFDGAAAVKAVDSSIRTMTLTAVSDDPHTEPDIDIWLARDTELSALSSVTAKVPEQVWSIVSADDYGTDEVPSIEEAWAFGCVAFMTNNLDVALRERARFLGQIDQLIEDGTLAPEPTAEMVMDLGRWEVIVDGTAPPVAVTNEAEDDWVYGWISG